MKVYKYHKINKNLLTSLMTKKHWFSRIDLLNDPNECLVKDQTENKIYEGFSKTLRVCCFSKNRDEILMWSHYADDHRGLCLEFECSEEFARTTLMQIEYKNEVPILDKMPLTPEGKFLINLNDNGKYLIRKFETWKYEEEVRVYKIHGDPIDNLKPGMTGDFVGELTAIYFGTNTPKVDIDLVKHVLKEDQIKYYRVGLDTETMKNSIINEV
jgi:hypothetical protein